MRHQPGSIHGHERENQILYHSTKPACWYAWCKKHIKLYFPICTVKTARLNDRIICLSIDAQKRHVAQKNTFPPSIDAENAYNDGFNFWVYMLNIIFLRIFKICKHIYVLKKPQSLENEMGRIARLGRIISIYPLFSYPGKQKLHKN